MTSFSLRAKTKTHNFYVGFFMFWEFLILATINSCIQKLTRKILKSLSVEIHFSVNMLILVNYLSCSIHYLIMAQVTIIGCPVREVRRYIISVRFWIWILRCRISVACSAIYWWRLRPVCSSCWISVYKISMAICVGPFCFTSVPNRIRIDASSKCVSGRISENTFRNSIMRDTYMRRLI